MQAGWAAVALVAVGPISESLDARSAPVAAVVGVALAAAWTAVAVALLVPRSAGLTVVRLAVPAVAAATWWLVTTGGGSLQALDVAAAVATGVAAVVALSPRLADALVDGSSYGPERRIPLRTPVAMAAVAVLLWVAIVAGAMAGPLLLAAGQVAGGAVAVVVGWAVAAAGGRSLHQLARRWLVLVPAGLVLHDPLTMPEPQLFLRQTMARLGPATAAEEGVVVEDLTAGASGLVIELRLDETVELLVYDHGRSTTLRTVDAVQFTPARPAELLREAADRRLPVR